MYSKRLFAVVALLCIAQAGRALDLDLAVVASGLHDPVYATQAPGDDSRIYIVERAGRILLVKDGVLQETPFLDLGTEVDADGGEQGLLGLAFPSDYATTGRFFIDYTSNTGAAVPPTRICRVQRNQSNPDIADFFSLTILLQITQPYSNHNGGMITFGPDGYLYIAMGDGGSGNDPDRNGQNKNALLGKLLRIDTVEGGEGAGTGGNTYDIPPSNPFAAGGGAPEIWAYGLRNPWRFSFDRQTGDLWIGDVGQNAQEEIDFQAAGAAGGQNYGWGVFEGTRCNTNYTGTTQQTCDDLAPSVTFPLYTLGNPVFANAIIGGYVYRGSAIPAMQGLYFYSDAGKSFIKTLERVGDTVQNVTDRRDDLDPTGLIQNIVSFGEDNHGELFVIDISGSVFKIVDKDAATEGEGEGEGEGSAEGEGEGEGEGETVHHSADQNSDGKLNLSELLRVIQFYNSHGLYCDAGTEDGYAPGAGANQTCAPHSSDYNPQDWTLSLSEILRAIQLYNSLGFAVCPGGEDGYCPQF